MNREKKFESIGSTEKWENGEKVSEATPLLRKKDNKKGISIKIGKKVNWRKRPVYGKTIWIDEDLDLPSWLNWFIKTIKKFYLSLFGRNVKTSIDEEVEYYKTKKEELSTKLADLQIKLEEAERKEKENKETLELAREAKLKHNKDFNNIYKEFWEEVKKSKTKNEGREESIKNILKKEPWLLGLECWVEAKNQKIDIQTQIDLHVKTKFNKDIIFEIKSPNKRPLQRKGDNKTRYIFSPELSEALSEIIYYLRRTDIYSEKAGEGVYGIQRAEGFILIGLDLTEEEKRILKEINFHLSPHITIITYNELKDKIEREISLLNNLELSNDIQK
jgi:Skp family chaperone for outer membrane proteins